MFHRFHDRFGTAGLVIAVVALVAALGGTALAAGALTTKQKKEVTKIAKQFAGKPGATGPAGTAGTPGTNGTPGKNGTNGTNGAKGEEGSPWTAGGFLPKGKSEKGAWSVMTLTTPYGFFGATSISFGLPLQSAPLLSYVNLSGEELVREETEPGEFAFSAAGPATNCLGSVEEPKAKEGFLCLYVGGSSEFGSTPLGPQTSVYAAGAIFWMGNSSAESAPVVGSWAVTAG